MVISVIAMGILFRWRQRPDVCYFRRGHGAFA
jgi:hypothetical protein